ncbi:MAG: DnaJ domain-containing protein [Gammaproteobacteria bacterium]|nr:DnaJ domain-containing protein [Gammaproteobacteria bacterium]NIR97321.1 DnaJ domain-containing protein [Gammaproteobacteria bacterium]NIT63364.1 DnaJ domain-containing protein [Gammaproteobacteria bacterium]NIV20291.1 DnaJ domain-containing protein [Gammaproteobacteria bacterium]NIX10708.1 DnaJ domain-containing protein [Gammaproteobacteria bacterium]
MASGPAAHLAARALELLHAHPEGLSEYELMRALEPEGAHGSETFRDPLRLFRAHFTLFHALYTLREELWERREAHLEIDPLRIRLHPYRAADRDALAARDPLRDYYMDPANLEDTSAGEVDEMLGRFWAALQADEQRHEALAVLGLCEPVDFATIKRRYRELAMHHHPDRGGSDAHLQRINEAMAVLTRARGLGGRPE